MKLKNMLTGVTVVVRATTDHPQSSYGKAVWVDEENQAYCQKGLELISGYEIVDQRKEFGQKLKSIRENKGLNKNHLIRRGMRIEAVNQIESGGANYTIDSLFLYLEIVGADLQCVCEDNSDNQEQIQHKE